MRFLTTFSLLFSIIGLSLFSLVFIYSSTVDVSSEATSGLFDFPLAFKKQMVFYLLGFIFMFAISRIPYQQWVYPAIFLYVINIIVLIICDKIGVIKGGAKSWIDLGFMMYQPSETMKTCWVLYLASYLRYRESYRTLSGLIPPFIITGIPVLLIRQQPDNGTAFLFIPTLFIILYLVGARLRHLGLIVLSLGLLCIPLWTHVLTTKQKARIYSYLSPDEYALSSAFQTNISLLAIGEGHWTGKGIGEGRVNQHNLLPEAHTDFIFSIVAEELGLIGALGLIICYMILLYTCYWLALRTREPFGRTIVIGIGTLLTVQALINISVAIVLIPTTGITLPFVSSGGSSFISSCIMIGLVLSVSRHHVTVLSKKDFE